MNECTCNRPWEGIPLWEIRMRLKHARENIVYFEAQYEDVKLGDPGAAHDAERERGYAADEADQLAHELWHRGESEA